MSPLVVRVSLPILLRVAAWACIVVLAVLSLLPGNDMWRTSLALLGYGTQIEHFIAYGGATVCIGLAYRARLGRLAVAAGLIVYAAVLETAQLYADGRNASLLDFLASAAGVVAGAMLLPAAWRSLMRLLAAGESAPPRS